MSSKTVVITGASSGIGKSISKALLNKGYHVIGMARRKERMEELSNAFPNQFTALEADITDADAVLQARELILSKYDEINGLINNAGIGFLGPLEDAPLSQWHTMVDVNLKGLLTVTHTFLPSLLAAKGHIINIDSVAGHEVYPESVVYCSTKWAVKALSMGIEKELRGRVKMTNISPGPVETEFSTHTTHERKAEQMKDYFKNVLKAEDISNAVVFALESPQHVAINELTLRPFK